MKILSQDPTLHHVAYAFFFFYLLLLFFFYGDVSSMIMQIELELIINRFRPHLEHAVHSPEK